MSVGHHGNVIAVQYGSRTVAVTVVQNPSRLGRREVSCTHSGIRTPNVLVVNGDSLVLVSIQNLIGGPDATAALGINVDDSFRYVNSGNPENILLSFKEKHTPENDSREILIQGLMFGRSAAIRRSKATGEPMSG
jgi:hypothetical protein